MSRRESVLLAYVFWHWKKHSVGDADYEARQRGFHAALSAAPPDGFVRSFSSASRVEWAPDGGGSYEDWYLVQDFTALGQLNEAAISGSRAAPHNAAASVAAGGTAGLYGLRTGEALLRPALAAWFRKPDGMPYRELDERLGPIVDESGGALWMRQMTLGPAPEFCLHAHRAVTLPPVFSARVVTLRSIWPDS